MLRPPPSPSPHSPSDVEKGQSKAMQGRSFKRVGQTKTEAAKNEKKTWGCLFLGLLVVLSFAKLGLCVLRNAYVATTTAVEGNPVKFGLRGSFTPLVNLDLILPKPSKKYLRGVNK